MPSDRIIELARRYFAGIASEAEKSELHRWYDEWQDDEEQIETGEYADDIKEQIRGRLFEQLVSHRQKTASLANPGNIKPLFRNRLLVAASVILILGLLSYFMFLFTNESAKKFAEKLPGDIKAPSVSKATITLADGTTVPLDSLQAGTITTLAGVEITKTADGKIIYSGSTGMPILNTLFNPKASKVVNLVLEDGTKVWLNNESSIKYPMAFTGSTREVEITGEAYFEVRKMPGKKFLVKSGNVTTEVLGTHFNVNTYPDQGVLNVTLLEGAIKVSNASGFEFIKPGQQARIGKSISVSNDVDLKRVVAWKEGFLSFRGESLASIMKTVERLYDVQVVPEGNLSQRTFTGSVSRDVDLSELLKIFEASNIHFKLNGNKLTVIP